MWLHNSLCCCFLNCWTASMFSATGAKNTRWPVCVDIDTNESVHSSSGQACLTVVLRNKCLTITIWTCVFDSYSDELVCLTVVFVSMCIWQFFWWARLTYMRVNVCLTVMFVSACILYNYSDECVFDSYHCDHVFYNCPCEYVCLTIIIMNKCIWQPFWWLCVNSL